MASIAVEVLAIATAGILLVGYLEFGFSLLRRRTSRMWMMPLVGCAVIPLLRLLPEAVSGSTGVRLSTSVLLGVLLALWTVIRANLLNRAGTGAKST